MSAATPSTALDLLRKQSRKRQRDGTGEIVESISSSGPSLPLLLLPNNKNQQNDQRTTCPSLQRKNNDLSEHVKVPKWLLLNKSNGNGITEISGEAGAGKSQLCLSLCVSCILSKVSSSSVVNNECYYAMYITLGGEGDQSTQIAQRSYQMIQERIIIQKKNQMSQNQQCNYSGYDIKNLMKRIHIRHVHNEEELIQLIQDLPDIFQKEQMKFGIVVFDSIAGIFRTREDNSSSSYYAKRSGMFFNIAAKLKKISDAFQVHVVVVNQVTTSMEKVVLKSYQRTVKNPYSSSSSLSDTHHRRQIIERMVLKPSLGLAWSHCVNDRYILSRKEGLSCNTTKNRKFIRTLKLYTSSTFACNARTEVKYIIEPHGVVMSQ